MKEVSCQKNESVDPVKSAKGVKEYLKMWLKKNVPHSPTKHVTKWQHEQVKLSIVDKLVINMIMMAYRREKLIFFQI